MTTRRLYSTLVEVEANGAEPVIVGQTNFRKIQELERAIFLGLILLDLIMAFDFYDLREWMLCGE